MEQSTNSKRTNGNTAQDASGSPARDAGQEPRSQSARKAVYVITKREGVEKGFWTRIGVAFVNRDGSLNVKLDAVPVNGELHIRDFKDAEEPAQGD